MNPRRTRRIVTAPDDREVVHVQIKVKRVRNSPPTHASIEMIEDIAVNERTLQQIAIYSDLGLFNQLSNRPI